MHTPAPIPFEVPDATSEALGSLGRTEDVKFSPDGRRLAIAGFATNRILLLELESPAGDGSAAAAGFPGEGAPVRIAGHLLLASESLACPHGVTFIDDATIVVANRDGQVTVYRLPTDVDGSPARGEHRVDALGVVDGTLFKKVYTPGSVAVRHLEPGVHEILVCNNFIHRVSRHVLDLRDGFEVENRGALVEAGLDVPDGIVTSPDGDWMAVSNHGTAQVFMYAVRDELNRKSEPDGVLEEIDCPHGVRFTADGRHVLVAAAAEPYVKVFRADDDGGWSGARRPDAEVRVLDEETYLRGRTNPEEGGPKGLDIHPDMRLMAVTCEERILAFFDVADVLAGVSA